MRFVRIVAPVILALGLTAQASAATAETPKAMSTAEQRLHELETKTPVAPENEIYVGHFKGTMMAVSGEACEAELSLDRYKCYALSVMKEPGIETGFYEVKGDRIILKNTSGDVVRQFKVEKQDPTTLLQLDAEGAPMADAPKDCCRIAKD